MARATVSFEDYQEGRLPPLCVISGEPSDQVLVMRTPADDPTDAWINPPRWAKALDQLVTRIDARRSRDILLGRLPVAARHIERLDRVRKQWGFAQIVAALVFVWSASAGVASSPWLVVASLVALIWTGWSRKRSRQRLPSPILVHASTVIIDNVHPAFASALRD